MAERLSCPPMERQGDKPRMIATNKRARFEYHVLDERECGIALTGTEVKSLRAGRCSIAEAYALVRRGELWLVGMHVPEYAQGNIHNHPPVRERKLLLHRREIDAWEQQVKVKGITIVPLSIYFKGARIKVQMALCKGKKVFDKRETKKEQDAQREIDRAMMRRR
jgi:SsrA-binding protein